MSADPRLRIGELSRRVGVSPELLRAWETRYALVQPARTSGGLRLYSQLDERRVVLMRTHLAAGLSAAEAARLAKSGDDPRIRGDAADLDEIEEALASSVDALDEPAAQDAFDRLLSSVGLQSALSQVILPFLNRLGERWASGESTIAQEHFATNVIGGRLRALARGWGGGVGPRAVLACPPGERHELGLLCFGLALRERGWRVIYLGADTPLRDVAEAVARLTPTVVVLSATAPALFAQARHDMASLAKHVRVVIGGTGATADVARALGVEVLAGDVVDAAASLLA